MIKVTPPERIWVFPCAGCTMFAAEIEQVNTDTVEYVRADRIEELEAKLAVAVEIANSAVNALDEIQNYEQPNDPWAENALTMGELGAFDFSVFDARTTLAELKGDNKP